MATLFRIFVKAAAILMLFAAASVAQTRDKSTGQDSSDIKVLEERVKNIDEKMADNKAEIKDELDDKFQELNTRMYIYVGFVVAIIAFIGYFLNFFGKKTIITWVNEKISEIAKEELDDRLEPIYIKYKDERTKELEERWESRLKEIEEKWTSYQQEMKHSLKKIEDQQTIPAEEREHTIKSLEEVKQEKDFSAHDWFFKAYNEAQKGNHEKAIEYYSKAIEKNPIYATAYNNRGNSYSKLEKYEKSLADFDKAIEHDASYAMAYFNRAVTYYLLKEYEKALADYAKTIELDPNVADAYNGRGATYSELREYEKALADYTKAIELNPNKADAYSNRGATYFKLKEYKKGLADYDKAIELDPGYIIAYENIAELLICMGKYDFAIEKIDKAMIKPVEGKDKAVLVYLKCIARRLLGKDTIEAEIELEDILKKDIRLTWSSDEIEEWMKSADIPEKARAFITEKTVQMKAKKKPD